MNLNTCLNTARVTFAHYIKKTCMIKGWKVAAVKHGTVRKHCCASKLRDNFNHWNIATCREDGKQVKTTFCSILSFKFNVTLLGKKMEDKKVIQRLERVLSKKKKKTWNNYFLL